MPLYPPISVYKSVGGGGKGVFTSSPKGNDRSPESHNVIIKTQCWHQSRAVTLLQICEKQLFTIPTRILSMMMCIQNLVSFCQFVLKILSKNRILTSSKGSNSVANLRKTKIYNTNIDLVNDNVYTKFGLSLFIFNFLLKILSKNQILTSIKGFKSVANLRKTMIYITNIDLVNDNVYNKFGLNLFIRF